jgi:type II secretion system protein N
MKRLLVFVVLLMAFVVWTFPHRRVVDRMLARRLEGIPVDVAMGGVRPTLWPPGYTLSDVSVRSRGVTISLNSAQIDLLFSSGVRAHACGGTLDGDFTEPSTGKPGNLRLRFNGVDLSSCVKGFPISVTGAFAGQLQLEGLGSGPGGSLLGRTAARGSLAIEGTSGTLSGYLPSAPNASGESDVAKPIGSWEFARVALHAHLERGEILVDDASADAEGVHWDVSAARLAPGNTGRTRLSAELKARAVDDTPRAKAMIGILPRAGVDAEGWRSYRISGTLDSPKIVGLK